MVIYRGRDTFFEVQFTVGETPLDLRNITIECSVKDKPGGNLLFNANITIVDPNTGTVQVHFPSSQTANLKEGQSIFFDFKITFPDGTSQNFPWPPLQALVVEPVT